MENQTDQNSQAATIYDVDESNFGELVIESSANKLVLVDFWAPWCGPCKQLTPVLEEVINESNDLVNLAKLNIDENQQIAAQLRIQSIPTVFAFKDKKIIDGFQGALPKTKIIEFIEKIIGSTLKKDNSEIYSKIENLIKEGEFEQALSITEDSMIDHSDDPKIISFYISCLIELEKFENVNEFIKSLSKENLENDLIKAALKNYELIKNSKDGDSLEILIEKHNKNLKDVEIMIQLANKYFAEKKCLG